MTKLTPAQLTTVRDTNGQSTQLYLAKFEPNIVFQAQINDASILKGAKTITFNNVITGAYTNIVAGQSLYVGSTQGDLDLGRVRVRSTTSTQLTVAVDDQIPYVNSSYLTIRDYHEIWPVFPYTSLNTGTRVPTFYKDWDIVYSDQNVNFDPVVVMGTDFAGFWDAYSTGVYFTATGTYTVDGSTISSYAWTFPAGCTPTSSSAGTPGNVVFPAAGMYTVSLLVTASNGKTTTAYRHVMLLNRAYGTVGGQPYDENGVPKGKVKQLYQNIDDWDFDDISQDHIVGAIAKITVRDRASEFRDGDLVIIFKEDYYSNNSATSGQSVGGYPGRENILFVGYVDQAETTYDFSTSKTDFILKGTAAYLQNKEMYSVALNDTQGTPADWTFLKNMNINKGLNHYIRWHSTLLNVKDFRKITTGEGDYKEDVIQFQKGEILTMLNNFIQQRLLGFISSDTQGTLYAEIDLNILLTGSRPAAVMSFVEDDWFGTPRIKEVIEQPVSNVFMGGIAYDPTTTLYITGVPLLSRAPGQWQTYVGKSQNVSGLTLTSQSQLNNICGLYYAKLNNETPDIVLDLTNNMGNINLYPQEFYNFNLSGSTTYRNLIWNPKRIIPRKIIYKWDKFMLKQSITFEPETYGPPGDTIIIPVTIPGGTCTDCITPSPCDCVKNPSCDGCITPPGAGDGSTVYVSTDTILARTRNFLTASPTWTNCTGAFSGTIRNFILDPWNPVDRAYVVTTTNLYLVTNLNSDPPTWTSVLSAAAVQTALGIVAVRFDVACATIIEQDCIYLGWYSTSNSKMLGVSCSLNAGATWAHNSFITGVGGLGSDPRVMRLVSSLTASGKVYIAAETKGNFTPNSRVSVSTNHGSSWTMILDAGAGSHLWDVDVSYPDLDQTIIALVSNNAYYSHNNGSTFTAASTFTFSGANDGQGYQINIATSNQLDIMVAIQPGDTEIITRIYRSTDGGLTYTLAFSTNTYGGGVAGVWNIVALGRWPSDTNRVFWCSTTGAGKSIWYSADGLSTQLDKIGNWVSAIGAFGTPNMIVPLWLAY